MNINTEIGVVGSYIFEAHLRGADNGIFVEITDVNNEMAKFGIVDSPLSLCMKREVVTTKQELLDLISKQLDIFYT